ncbi:hypothetical protein QQ045_009322 [Rhodiola kirilowii]
MDKSAGEISLSIKLKSVTIGSMRVFECVNEALIPGLPDELALICLAKISHEFLGVLECVCKRWRDVIRSEEYAFYKSGMGRCGDWLFVLITDDDKSRYWKAYDPEADKWHLIPPMPRVNELVAFSQEWSEVASMSNGRAFFACSVICNKVYVGGGYSSGYNSEYYCPHNPLSSAEVYDPMKDSLHDRQWCSRRDVRRSEIQTRYGIVVINDHLYTIIGDSLQTVNIETGDWYHVGSMPAPNIREYPWSNMRSLICSLRNKIYVIECMSRYEPDHLVRQRTVRICNMSTTPLQWKKSTISGAKNVGALECASLEECLR